MKTADDLKRQIIGNHGIGDNLANKNEFSYLTKYINDDETLDSVIVCLIDGEICLVGFSDKRLFKIPKDDLIPGVIKRKGLEDIKDIELKDMETNPYLIISFYDSPSWKIEGIKLEKAQKFGQQIIKRIKDWQEKY